jgi:putative colanic acid biosynthesis UDP-glucose lipid carrier transferase
VHWLVRLISLGRGVAQRLPYCDKYQLLRPSGELILLNRTIKKTRMINRQNVPIQSGFHRRHGGLFSATQQGLDIIAVVCSLYFLTLWVNNRIGVQYQVLALVAGLLVLVVYRWSETYSNLRLGGILDDARALLQPWIAVLLCLITLGFLTKTTQLFSRQVIISWAVLGYMSQVAVHSVVRITLRALRERGFNLRYAAVVGMGDQAGKFAERLRANPWLGIEVVGRIDAQRSCDGVGPSVETGALPYLGHIGNIEAVTRDNNIDMIYIALPLTAADALEDTAEAVMRLSIDTHWVPDIEAFQLINHGVWQVDGQPVIALSDTPYDGFKHVFKWLEDKVLAFMLLMFFLVPMIIIGVSVKLSSPGPVFFRQIRHGLNGKTFRIWKFRTMKVHNERRGVVTQAIPNDSRITAVGAFLRRSSLDELPQLINVLRGDMSLVGPRPHALEHNQYYGSRIAAYMLRHRIKPGITGLAQINGFRGRTPTDDDMRKRVHYDIFYINNWSPWLDVKILFLTAGWLITKRDAY